MVELADTRDLKSLDQEWLCGFKSRWRYYLGLWLSGLKHLPYKQGIMGSTPISPTINSSHNKSYFEFLAHLVEHITINYTVVGSNPTKFFLLFSYFHSLLINFGAVAKMVNATD